MASQPWLAPPPAADPNQDFLIVGAGIAGASTARVLAERGCKVRVMDVNAPATGASGNPAAVVRPVLARDPDDPLCRFYTDAFNATVRRINSLREQGHSIAGAFEGVLHCHPQAQDQRGPALHQYLDKQQAQARLGSSLQGHGVWLNEAGWVSPVDYCCALLAHENIEFFQAELACLEHDGLAWELLATDGSRITFADNVVLANGWRLSQLAPTESLPINPVASQLLHFKGKHAGTGPSVPVVGGGTLVPTNSGWMVTAGHWHDTTDDAVDLTRNEEILSRSAELWNMPDNADDASIRAAVRATSRDYLPMVGGVPDFELASDIYEDVHHGRPSHHYPPTPHLPGQYLLAALGGRGISSAQLCAELLGAIVFGEEHPWQKPLHPLRFLMRQLKRGRPPH